MDRLVIVAYINTSNMHHGQIGGYLEQIRNQLKDALSDDDIVWVFPTQGGNNRLELLNRPNIIVGEEYAEELTETLNKFEERLNELGKTKN